MNVSSLSDEELNRYLCGEGLYLRTGSFVSRIQSGIISVAEGIASLYGDYPLETVGSFADFHISLYPPNNHRRWFRKQVVFYVDKSAPFKPLAFDQAFAFLEWGLNWCVSSYSNHMLILHAAVIEKNGFALIMPGLSGSGKNTLCAALVSREWRLLSDELTMVSLTDGNIIPLPRPVSLKNKSIEIIRQFNPDAVIGQISHDTAKGSVAHMRVPTAHVERAEKPACPAWVVFPKYIGGAELSLDPLSKGHGAIRLIENAFNYSILGEKGFHTVTRVIDQCDCYEFKYSVLDEAISCFDALAESKQLTAGVLND